MDEDVDKSVGKGVGVSEDVGEAKAAHVSHWSGRRVAGEIVLGAVLAGLAGLSDAVAAGFGLRTFAVCAGVAVLGAARRSLPATVLVVSAATAGELLAAAPLLMCVSWSAGHRVVDPRRAVAAFGAAFVFHAALSVRGEITAADSLSLPVAGGLATGVFLVLSVGPALVARYRAQRRELLAVLRRHNEQLVREQAMVARQARLLERNRVARDMHDSLGHQLVLISVHAGALQVGPDLDERRRECVRILRDASVTAMEELREAVGVLHEDRPEDRHEDRRVDRRVDRHENPSSRTIASLDDLVRSSRAAGATVEVHRSGTARPLAPAADHTAYRIAQEGLTNAHKHAPGAPITVSLRYEPDALVVEVANGPVPAGVPDVPGPAAIGGGRGLGGLRERARLVGGMVHTGPGADGGFRVAGMLPYGTATSVGPDDDFVGQRGAGAVDDGGPAINRADPQGEFAATMSRRKNIAIGCAATAVVLVVGVLALGAWGMNALMEEGRKVSISPRLYESARIGDSEAALREELPEGDSVLTEGLEEQGPPTPEGATCRHFMSDDPDGVMSIYFRFCFRDGRLVDKQTFTD
ncbi:sensor histidine kinase [Streptomyces griseiscabiei]|uniref:histidine kinase n=1 Tax=Streptomyces griseiscabiei TaxID=2993540 RepID=A0ABU4LHK3_9ACTN|nr:histidine kinase [Streptomyces griseiscabiei]MBZ3908003.1 two-component sensor histidine kinase [Streptomyces griseiscabiei]MDX2915152.1 histidine kinase [Streptomyces griseiscabiei]